MITTRMTSDLFCLSTNEKDANIYINKIIKVTLGE